MNAAVSFIPRNLNDIAIAKTAAKISRAERMQTCDQIGDDDAIGVPLVSLGGMMIAAPFRQGFSESYKSGQPARA